MSADNPLDIDTRVKCNACRHRAAGWCTNAVTAGLHRTRTRQEVGPQLAAMPQHCRGYATRSQRTSA